MSEPLRILVIGAHPDDCDYHVGGLAVLYARQGHQVRFVSMSNGDAGHFSMGGAPLAQRRRAEAERAAAIASDAAGRPGSVEYQVLDVHDAQIVPSLENRQKVVCIMRQFRPDLVITNRPNDYHPDHRYTSQLVADAAYTVMVPNVAALTPHLSHNPVIAYWGDGFKRPYPFTPDVSIATDEVIQVKMRMLACHVSQFYEWIPYSMGRLEEVPQGESERLEWFAAQRLRAEASHADATRGLLARLYGPERGNAVTYAEPLEFCEYGGVVTDANFARLFPFFGPA